MDYWDREGPLPRNTCYFRVVWRSQTQTSRVIPEWLGYVKCSSYLRWTSLLAVGSQYLPCGCHFGRKIRSSPLLFFFPSRNPLSVVPRSAIPFTKSNGLILSSNLWVIFTSRYLSFVPSGFLTSVLLLSICFLFLPLPLLPPPNFCSSPSSPPQLKRQGKRYIQLRCAVV